MARALRYTTTGDKFKHAFTLISAAILVSGCNFLVKDKEGKTKLNTSLIHIHDPALKEAADKALADYKELKISETLAVERANVNRMVERAIAAAAREGKRRRENMLAVAAYEKYTLAQLLASEQDDVTETLQLRLSKLGIAKLTDPSNSKTIKTLYGADKLLKDYLVAVDASTQARAEVIKAGWTPPVCLTDTVPASAPPADDDRFKAPKMGKDVPDAIAAQVMAGQDVSADVAALPEDLRGKVEKQIETYTAAVKKRGELFTKAKSYQAACMTEGGLALKLAGGKSWNGYCASWAPLQTPDPVKLEDLVDKMRDKTNSRLLAASQVRTLTDAAEFEVCNRRFLAKRLTVAEAARKEFEARARELKKLLKKDKTDKEEASLEDIVKKMKKAAELVAKVPGVGKKVITDERAKAINSILDALVTGEFPKEDPPTEEKLKRATMIAASVGQLLKVLPGLADATNRPLVSALRLEQAMLAADQKNADDLYANDMAYLTEARSLLTAFAKELRIYTAVYGNVCNSTGIIDGVFQHPCDFSELDQALRTAPFNKPIVELITQEAPAVPLDTATNLYIAVALYGIAVEQGYADFHAAHRRIAALPISQTLLREETTLSKWDALLEAPLSQLAAYHSGGITDEELTGFIATLIQLGLLSAIVGGAN
ncbi:MAG: hypothetical protein ABJR55_14000 [Alphaproteobacteria bacterium]